MHMVPMRFPLLATSGAATKNLSTVSENLQQPATARRPKI